MSHLHNREFMDVRVVQSYLSRGIITQEQYDAFLASLPDDAANAVDTDTRMMAGAVLVERGSSEE